MFPTGETGPAPYNPSSVDAYVKYGVAPSTYNSTVKGQNSVVYNQIYGPNSGNLTYQSPILHHVLLTGLVPGRKYFYVVGNDVNGWSPESSFTMFPSSSPSIRIGVWGDIGQTANSSTTFDNVVSHSPDIILNMADFT